MTSIVRTLRAVDALTIVFSFFLLFLSLLFAAKIHEWGYLVVINIFSTLVITVLAYSSKKNAALRFMHDWYPVPVIFLIFKEVYVVIQSLGLHDLDATLISIDRAIFHVDPTVWLSQFTTPFLTELLQLAYVSYYFLMITLGVEVLLKRERRDFSFVIFTITYGFYLSYLGYLAFPAVGPRFTLHSFGSLDHELPGLFLTEPLRNFINAGESIPRDAVNPIALAQRDAFPSGHAQMTLIVMFLAYQFRLRSRWPLYIMGTLLIISTVYLRYHYVVDLLGGALFMVFTVWSAPKIFAWWERRTASSISSMRE